MPAELITDASAGVPVVLVARTNTPLGPEDVFYIRTDEDSDVLDAAEQAGFLVLRGGVTKMDTGIQPRFGALSSFGFWGLTGNGKVEF